MTQKIRFFTKQKEIDLLEIKPEDIDLEWIDLALNHTFRWRCMTTPNIISVAQHSYVCGRLVAAFPDIFKCKPYHALMHDMAEAFISDIPSTLKDCFPGIEKIEMNVLRVIYEAAGLPFPSEAEQVHVNNVDSWSGKFEAFRFHPQNDWLNYDFAVVKPFGLNLTADNLEASDELHHLFDVTDRLYQIRSFSFLKELDTLSRW